MTATEAALTAIDNRGRAPDDELAAVYERVKSGIEWLSTNDESGAFHFWFESGITPRSPMPGQEERLRARYSDYYNARVLFGKLWSKMERLERREDRR